MRLLVVSHAAVLPVNQGIYGELASRGIEVTIVVPSQWRHDFAQGAFAPAPLRGLEGRLLPLRVALAGRPQRHFYLANLRRVLARVAPDLAFVEEEAYSLAATQWCLALSRCRVPFGVQAYENLDRSLPAPVRALRRAVLHKAAFVAARSETAANLVRQWGSRGHVAIVAPPVPAWDVTRAASQARPFTVGYAGRLVTEKGLFDLLAAVRQLEPPVELLLAGNGELRSALEGQQIPGSVVRVLPALRHDQMPDAYASMDVLALPSHSTPLWKEQFGRVILEALSCGVPVVGSDSGEIPWLIRLTQGGIVVPEGDVDALSAALATLRTDPERRAQLGAAGRAAVKRMFTVTAAADAFEDLLAHIAPTTPPTAR